MPAQANVEELILQRMKWYDAHAHRAYFLFVGSKAVQIVAAAAIPLLALGKVSPYVTAAVGAIVAVAIGLGELLRFHEKWINYRATCEALRDELFLYEAQAGPYARPGASTTQLAERAFGFLGEERRSWLEMARQAGAHEAPAAPVGAHPG